MSLVADNPAGFRRPRAQRPDPAAIARVRAALVHAGKTVADWARENGEADNIILVHRVLSGTRPCISGAQHRIAVKLGLKEGIIDAGTGTGLDDMATAP
jgi:gp16 family phage-associated protein